MISKVYDEKKCMEAKSAALTNNNKESGNEGFRHVCQLKTTH